MAPELTLTVEERNFFYLVRKAVQCNPFSEERDDLNVRIAGFYNLESEADPLEKTIADVRKRVASFSEKGRDHLDCYGHSDRQLLKHAFLFDFFHLFLDAFDRLIQTQVGAGDKPIRVDFSSRAIAMLTGWGFSREDALRYFSLGYQLRRAFYFIDRSLVGKSPAMRKLRESLWNNVFTSDITLYEEFLWNRMEDFSTLIMGETGTGKGRAAMAIGRSGFIPFDSEKGCFAESFTTSFVSINLSQFPESLIESELFGHCKGAFTGAVKDHQGIFSRCSPCGAIFLDEIGEVAPSLQIKLLKVLEEREFSPVGSRDILRFKGLVIAATNRPVREIVKKGLMREDFFYRLCSDLIVVPPLRERIRENPGELNDLTAFTIGKIVGKTSPALTSMVTGIIRKQPGTGYSWPGNVRELGQCIRRILLNRKYSGLTFSAPLESDSDFIRAISKGDLEARQLLKGYCNHLYAITGTYGEVSRKTGLDRRTVKKYIEEWMDES